MQQPNYGGGFGMGGGGMGGPMVTGMANNAAGMMKSPMSRSQVPEQCRAARKEVPWLPATEPGLGALVQALWRRRARGGPIAVLCVWCLWACWLPANQWGLRVCLCDPSQGKGRTGKDRKGKERKGKEREGKGREGKGREGKGREGMKRLA
eukprot:1158655-Pelagomonas_calceolata.AAC.6